MFTHSFFTGNGAAFRRGYDLFADGIGFAIEVFDRLLHGIARG